MLADRQEQEISLRRVHDLILSGYRTCGYFFSLNVPDDLGAFF